jgi:hypothetical protein
MTHKLYELLDRLEALHCPYTLHRTQPDHVTILVTLPGQRVEIYVSSAGEVLYSVFTGDESVESDLSALLTLLERDA